AGTEKNGVGSVALELPGDEVTNDDTAGLSVDEHEVHHLTTVELLDLALRHHLHHAGVGTEKELLASLSAGVERPGNLGATERAVIEVAAVFAGERNTLGNHLV